MEEWSSVASPITGEMVPIREIVEHMQIDPKYTDQKERMMGKLRETTLAPDAEISRNIMASLMLCNMVSVSYLADGDGRLVPYGVIVDCESSKVTDEGDLGAMSGSTLVLTENTQILMILLTVVAVLVACVFFFVWKRGGSGAQKQPVNPTPLVKEKELTLGEMTLDCRAGMSVAGEIHTEEILSMTLISVQGTSDPYTLEGCPWVGGAVEDIENRSDARCTTGIRVAVGRLIFACIWVSLHVLENIKLMHVLQVYGETNASQQDVISVPDNRQSIGGKKAKLLVCVKKFMVAYKDVIDGEREEGQLWFGNTYGKLKVKMTIGVLGKDYFDSGITWRCLIQSVREQYLVKLKTSSVVAM